MLDYRLARMYLKFLFKIFYIEVSVKGEENIPDKGPYIVASNHQSNLDPVIMFHTFPKPLPFMAKRELFKVPVFSWIMRQTDNFSVKRGTVDRKSLKAARQRLDEGRGICIFPEGTRSTTGVIRPFKSGISYIWKDSGFPPILPMTICGSLDILRKGEFIPRPAKVKITYGKLLRIPEEVWDEHNRKESAKKIAGIIEERVKELMKDD